MVISLFFLPKFEIDPDYNFPSDRTWASITCIIFLSTMIFLLILSSYIVWKEGYPKRSKLEGNPGYFPLAMGLLSIIFIPGAFYMFFDLDLFTDQVLIAFILVCLSALFSIISGLFYVMVHKK